MSELKSLAKDTAIYGLSSIVGRFLNYLLVPLYTVKLAAQSGGYGVVTNLYAYTALLLVILTFGMETTFFRFANKLAGPSDGGSDAPSEGKEEEAIRVGRVFSSAMSAVGGLCLLFLLLVFGFLPSIAQSLGYAAHPEYIGMMAIVVALDALQAIPFSLLRYQQRAVKFACLKLLFIILNIGLNLLYFVLLPLLHTKGYPTPLYSPQVGVGYVFALNLVCTAFITLFFIPELRRIRWQADAALLRRMLSYAWPILVLGIAGILNQTADKMLFPLVYPGEGHVQLGIYGACVKIAMIMAMITQAFRYAYEPFVFAKSKERGSGKSYAEAMKFFVIFTLLAFLCVMGWMDVLQHLIGRDYREGLRVVPIVMVAEIMMGVYFNLSFWYKLIDKTIWGAWFSMAGCAVLVAVNLLFIPRFGYMACAWGGVAGYGTAMLLSYFVGQRKHPIAYPLRAIGAYVLLCAILYALMAIMPKGWPTPLRLLLNTLLILLFALRIVRRDMPLSALPLIGKYFRK